MIDQLNCCKATIYFKRSHMLASMQAAKHLSLFLLSKDGSSITSGFEL
uniref:Uncharacterized protein n=1 Tax=Arundo donax TaxID=35708 RepID=A0A0A9EH81_ARUDO